MAMSVKDIVVPQLHQSGSRGRSCYALGLMTTESETRCHNAVQAN
jgi:hypothetical protein